MSNIPRNCERKRGSSDSPEFTSWLFTDGRWTITLEVHSRTSHEGAEGEYRYIYTLFLTSALDGEWVDNVTPRPLYPQERLGTHCVGGWTGTRAGLDEFGPRTFRPVAIRYTDWAIPVRWTIMLVINVIQCLWNTTSWVPTLHAWDDSQMYVLF